MNPRCHEIMEVLKEAAASDEDRLDEKVRRRLNDTELEVLDWLTEQYQDERKKRWYDRYHVLFSTDFALDLVAANPELDRLIVTGIMLHDIGYFAITDKSMWSHPHMRIIHMQEGAALAAKVLSRLGFEPEELEKVLGMIAVHDNPYIGIEIKGRDRKGMRDCDRVWVMHMLSFYKDVCSKAGRYEQPKDFLHDRMTQFFAGEQPFGREWEISADRVERNAERIEVPTNPLTKERVQEQFERRIAELSEDDFFGESFKDYVQDNLINE